MERIVELYSQPMVGKTYLVPTVQIMITNHIPLQIMDIPILGEAHEDANFGQTPDWHFHIDIRFISDEDLKSFDPTYRCENQYTKSVIAINATYMENMGMDKKIVEKPIKCLREQDARLQNFFANDSGELDNFTKKLKEQNYKLPEKCIKCPHNGTYLSSIQPINGVIKCPAHGMRFDSKTRIPLYKNEEVL